MREVIKVGRELQDHWEARGSDGALQHLFNDRIEIKVDVVAGDVELYGGKLTRLCTLVDRLYQRAKLIGTESAKREDPILFAGAREVFVKVAINPNV